jgi:hypothetical protein
MRTYVGFLLEYAPQTEGNGNSSKSLIYKTAWYWRIFSLADILLSLGFIWRAQNGDLPSDAARWAFSICGVFALLLGVMSWVYLKTHTITLDGHFLKIKYAGIKEAVHDLTQLVALRKRNFYITLDYGRIPRVAILALTNNNLALFKAISKIAFARR